MEISNRWRPRRPLAREHRARGQSLAAGDDARRNRRNRCRNHRQHRRDIYRADATEGVGLSRPAEHGTSVTIEGKSESARQPSERQSASSYKAADDAIIVETAPFTRYPTNISRPGEFLRHVHFEPRVQFNDFTDAQYASLRQRSCKVALAASRSPSLVVPSSASARGARGSRRPSAARAVRVVLARGAARRSHARSSSS